MAGFIPSFIFGGDTGNTPEALKLQRQMAMQAMLAQDSPKNVGEGFNSIGRSIAAALMDRQASEQEKAGQAGALEAMRGSETLGPLLGGGGGLSSMPAPTGDAGTPARPQGLPRFAATDGASPSGTFAEIAPKLSADLQRDFGLSQAQTAGVVGNLAHESGGFGSLQEKNPLVPGSRGGFGYAQWTGPRRVAFENWSAQNGLDPTSYDANYGFLKHELTNTPEGRVLGALKQAPDAQAATRVFSDQFLRPGIPGMESRMKWADRAMAGQPVQVASASPDALPIPPGQYLAQRQAEMDQAARDSGPAIPAPAQAPVLGANGLPSPFVKQQVAQAAPAQMGGSLSPGDRAALANPFVPQSMKEIIIKKATRDPAEMQLKQLELQKAQRDVNGPGYSLDIQGKQLANQKARKELGAEQLQSIYDENGNEVKGYYRNGQFVTVGGAKAKDDPNSVQEYTYYVNQEKAQGRDPKPYEQWQINKNRAGATVIDQRQESEFAKATGSAMAKRFNDLATEGDDAAQNATVITDLRRLGDKIGTGAGAATKKRFADWGIKFPGAGDVEAYSALIDKLTPQQRVPGTGATSDFDAKMFKGSLPTLMNTPEGNKTILDTMERLNNNKMARGDVAMRVQIGELTPKQGVEEIRKLQAEAKAISDQFKPANKAGQSGPQQPVEAPQASPDGWIDMGNGLRVRKVR